MVARALQLWQEYEKRWNLKLFFRSGALRMAGSDDSYETAALPALKEAGIPFEKLSVAECARRWPQMDFDGVSWSIYEPESGFLAARRTCEAVLDVFLKQEGQYRQVQATPGRITANRMDGVSIGVGEVLKADSYVFAPGPWLGKVFPFLAASITPTRQEVFFFGTPAGDSSFREDHLPTWIDGGKHPFFGVPGNHWRGFKIADDTRAPIIDPSTMERQVSEEKLAAARAYLRMRFPALAGAPLLESRVCQYENSTDHNFILDRRFAQRGTGTDRMCFPLPTRSAITQRSSRTWKSSVPSPTSSARRSPHPMSSAKIARSRLSRRLTDGGSPSRVLD